MTATKLTNDQYTLLHNLYTIGPRRTNVLAKSLGWDNQHTPHVGLQLREQQLVSSTNDGAEYNKWDITATGRAKYLEETAARRPKKEAPVTVPADVDYWVKCNGDNLVFVYSSYAKAENKAKELAAGGRNSSIFECRKLSTVKQVPATIEVIKS